MNRERRHRFGQDGKDFWRSHNSDHGGLGIAGEPSYKGLQDVSLQQTTDRSDLHQYMGGCARRGGRQEDGRTIARHGGIVTEMCLACQPFRPLAKANDGLHRH